MGTVNAGLGVRTVAFLSRRATRLTNVSANVFAKVAGPLKKGLLGQAYMTGKLRESATAYNFVNFPATRVEIEKNISSEQAEYFRAIVESPVSGVSIDTMQDIWTQVKRIQLDPAAGYFKLLELAWPTIWMPGLIIHSMDRPVFLAE
jgi:hypothetical protein